MSMKHSIVSMKHRLACAAVRELEGQKWNFLCSRELRHHEISIVDDAILRYFVSYQTRVFEKHRNWCK